MTAAPPYFTQFLPPHYRLLAPDRELSEADFELAAITVEDFRHVTRPMTEELASVPAEIRARATILRRLLSDHDIFRAGKVLKPESELRVRARMLDFTPIHPAFLLSCGNYPWVDDRLPGISMSFSMKGVPPAKGTPWHYRDDADVSLPEYLDGLAFAVVGTPVRRRDVVKYVGDKKAAHVSDKRKHHCEQALDRVWSILNINICNQQGETLRLNQVYLEILAIIEALTTSSSIQTYVDTLEHWVSTAEPFFCGAISTTRLSMPVEPS
jgi:hypothetical protein